jgi:hypothetical protein
VGVFLLPFRVLCRGFCVGCVAVLCRGFCVGCVAVLCRGFCVGCVAVLCRGFCVGCVTGTSPSCLLRRGITDASGQCCLTTLDASGLCCNGPAPKLDRNGACCPNGNVDTCGNCNGNITLVDVLGQCCDGAWCAVVAHLPQCAWGTRHAIPYTMPALAPCTPSPSFALPSPSSASPLCGLVLPEHTALHLHPLTALTSPIRSSRRRTCCFLPLQAPWMLRGCAVDATLA